VRKPEGQVRGMHAGASAEGQVERARGGMPKAKRHEVLPLLQLTAPVLAH